LWLDNWSPRKCKLTTEYEVGFGRLYISFYWNEQFISNLGRGLDAIVPLNYGEIFCFETFFS
jgi:hypothetical protein